MLKIGSLNLKVPIVLSPMADYTNLPYRLLCSNDCENGLFIEEMISSKAIINTKKPLNTLVDTSKKEKIRSLQLYVLGSNDTDYAIQKIKDNDLADHIDLNFGCPVKKVTKNGGGSAIPWKTALFTSIVKSAVKACGKIPLTIKLRLGIDNEHLTYLESGRIAESLGVSGIFLHCRTAAQYYHGAADWSAIKKLKDVVKIPVIGNGDVISIDDYQKMLSLGADGVAIGRGALGRPWIFEQISAYVLKNKKPSPITVEDVIAYIQEHLKLMLEYTNNNEQLSIKLLRKFYIYYFKGIKIGGELRNELVKISTVAEQKKVFEKIVKKIGLNTKVNEKFIRGRQGNLHKVSLPYGWLNNKE